MSKPPLGVLPHEWWEEMNPSPTQQDLHDRLRAVEDAAARYAAAGRPVPAAWEAEARAIRAGYAAAAHLSPHLAHVERPDRADGADTPHVVGGQP